MPALLANVEVFCLSTNLSYPLFSDFRHSNQASAPHAPDVGSSQYNARQLTAFAAHEVPPVSK